MSEVLHHFESVVTNGDAWGDTEVLATDVGLIETDAETKIATSLCEGAHASL